MCYLCHNQNHAASHSGGSLLNPAPAISGDQRIASIQSSSNYWNTSALTPVTITYSFTNLPSIREGSSGGYINPLTTAAQAAVIDIFSQASSVSNITFVQDNIAPDLKFGDNDLPMGVGEFFPDFQAPMNSAAVYIDTSATNFEGFAPGQYGYYVLMHEIMHALGGKHPGNYSEYDVGPFLPGDQDHTTNSVLSYNGSVRVTNLGAYDQLLLQYLYGSNVTAATAGSLLAGPGNDSVVATESADSIGLGAGNDTMWASGGDDDVNGNQGDDSIEGGAGNDMLYGGKDNDVLQGNTGNDYLNGNNGNDNVMGGRDSDTVRGGQDNDTVNGNIGNDEVYGDLGNDYLYGGQDNDTLYGGDGNDTLAGDRGNDVLYGGSGADVFVVTANSGILQVMDFEQGSDRLDIDNSYLPTAVQSASITAGSTVISLGAAQVALIGFSAPLSDSDFF